MTMVLHGSHKKCLAHGMGSNVCFSQVCFVFNGRQMSVHCFSTVPCVTGVKIT